MKYVIIFSLVLLALIGSASAEGADNSDYGRVPYMIAFLAGVISVLSPCGVPLLFGYLAVISQEKHGFWTKTLAFFLGLLVIWVPLGLSASGIGNIIAESGFLLHQIAGVLIIIFGLIYLFDITLPSINITKKVNTSVLGMFGFGVLFTLAWIPCVGPILGSILMIASTGGFANGGLLLTLYAAGFMMSLIGIFIFIKKSGKKLQFNKGFRIMGRSIGVYNLIGGLFLISLGVLYITEQFSLLVALMMPLTDIGFILEMFILSNPAAAGFVALLIIVSGLLLARKNKAKKD